MKLIKAIEVLQDIIRCVQPGEPPEEHDALKLGVGALQRLQEHRTKHVDIGFRSLPSETKE